MALLEASALAAERGWRLLFHHLSFELDSGGLLLLTGPNGSGKTTLIRMLAGLHRPLAGRLSWQGQAVDRDPDAQRRRIAYVGHLPGIKPALSPREQLAFEARLLDAPADRLAEAERRFNLARFAGLSSALLSAGQRRRSALARLVLSSAALWLLDEPATSLDAEGEASLWALVAEHRAQGGLVVVASHAALPLEQVTRVDLADFAPAPEPAREPA
jgi:heme exporter protein A